MNGFTVTRNADGTSTYQGLCRVCGAQVTVIANFLSTSYLTCNMDRTTPAAHHSGDDLRRVWQEFAGGA